jgi:nitrate reductase alpha subunit
MAMGHVILKEFWVERRVDYFERYARSFTDLPLLVTLRERDGAFVPDRFLRASDIGADEEHPEWKTVVLDERTGRPTVPNGSSGHRYQSAPGSWNLRLDGRRRALSLLERRGAEAVAVDLPRFDEPGVLRRGVPALRVGGQLVTTVLDLMLAQYGVGRNGLPGEWPQRYDDPVPYTSRGRRS